MMQGNAHCTKYQMDCESCFIRKIRISKCQCISEYYMKMPQIQVTESKKETQETQNTDTHTTLIRESPPQLENRIMARVYVRSITRSTMYQKLHFVSGKTSSVVCGFSSIKIDYSDYLKSLISRINEAYVFFNKYFIGTKNNNINFILAVCFAAIPLVIVFTCFL